MAANVLSPESAPRDPNELLKLKRGIRYRLGLQLGMFANDDAEKAFLSASNEDQAQALSAALLQLDQNGEGSIATAEAQPQMMPPQQPVLPPTAQPAAPPAAMVPMGGVVPPPPQGGLPMMPSQAAQVAPQAPAQPPPPAAQVVPPPAPQQAPQPQQAQLPLMPPAQPAMPSMSSGQPQMPPQAPQAPPVAPPPARQPQTASDPTNAGTGGAGGNTAGLIQAVNNVLKKVAEANEATQEWLQEFEDSQMGLAKMLQLSIALQLVVAENINIGGPEVLAKLVSQLDQDAVSSFLKQFTEDDEGKGE